MTPAAIIQQASADGVNIDLSRSGTIKATGDQSAVDRWIPLIRDNKPDIVALLSSDARRKRVLTMLLDNPGTMYAVEVDDADTDPVIVAVAIRGQASFEMTIPAAHYDGLALLEVLEQHSMEKAVAQ